MTSWCLCDAGGGEIEAGGGSGREIDDLELCSSMAAAVAIKGAAAWGRGKGAAEWMRGAHARPQGHLYRAEEVAEGSACGVSLGHQWPPLHRSHEGEVTVEKMVD